VVITTNNERALPDAFVRRCQVLQLKLPEEDGALKRFLIGRGEKHFAGAPKAPKAPKAILAEAADRLVAERRRARENRHYPLPGQAEYLDLVRAVIGLTPDETAGLALLREIAEYTFRKHPGAVE
jgi:hypothetical protein